MSNQTLMFDEINWAIEEEWTPTPGGSPQQVRGAPQGNTSGVTSNSSSHTPPEVSRPPYWEYDYQLSASDGLKLTNVNVRDTHSAGALEQVFEFIDFTDLEVEFTDGTIVPFDMAAAFSSGTVTFVEAENGSRTTVTPNDPLFQRGLKLTIVHNVLSSSGGTCNITLNLSVVFRGAANDFDPGGVPVAVDIWPQIAFAWDNRGATKQVRRFRGTVRFLLRNKMSPLGDMMVMNGNVPGYFTDSNESMNDGRRYRGGVRSTVSGFGGMPFGWRMVFDYLTANFSQEKEVIGVYGPNDGNKFRQSSASPRTRDYQWPTGGMFPPTITLAKRDRQGYFDNTHTHAKMHDDGCNNVPVHAPFCGHSCIHLHWRWAALAVTGAEGGRGWQFKGWSSRGGRSQAYSTNGAPLIPPNQKLIHATTTPTRTRHSHDHIVNSASLGSLDSLRKLHWYWVDIFDPAANEAQVMFEHGMGWAYRYALPEESTAVRGLRAAMSDDLPWFATPTQQQMAEFFDHVYEVFRYWRDCVDQVPPGSHTAPGTISMEDL